MRNKLKKPLSLREIIPQALKTPAASDKASLYHLQEKWGELVGPLLGKKSLPLKIYGKRLIVGVAGSAWAQELEFLKQPLLKKIHQSCPALTLDEIRFQMTTESRGSI